MKPEKIKLVYFSPTHTTKKVLEGIAKGINIDISDVTDITKPAVRNLEPPVFGEDLVLIGAPVYSGRLQQNAAAYFKKIKANNTPAVLVALYGNRAYEDALLELKDTAIMSGFSPMAIGAFIGEHSYASDEFPLGQNRPDSVDIEKAEAFGKEIAAKLKKVENIDSISDVRVPGNTPYKERMKSPAIDFIEVTDACTHCDVCVEACPNEAIDEESGYSVDLEECICCCACIKSCPENARVIKDGMIKDIMKKLSQTCSKRKEPETFF